MDDLAALQPAEIAAAQNLTGVTTLVLCAFPRYKGVANRTLPAGEPDFDSAVALLSRPNSPTPAGTVCAAYGDIVDVILAVTTQGTYLVHPPTDICGHYLQPLPRP